MAALVPYCLSEGEVEPPAKRRRETTNFTGDFFGPGAGGICSSSDEEEEGALAAEVPRPLLAGAVLLPSVDALFASVARPDFLEPTTRPLATLDSAATCSAHVRSTIGGAPVRYTAEQAEKRAQLSALRREEAAAALPVDEPALRAPRRPTKAVSLEKAAANPQASLPRREQERKDRERLKREKGQSSHAAWKSEAEMVLRQQYDT